MGRPFFMGVGFATARAGRYERRHAMTLDATPDQILAELRVDIDRIDAGMHALLIERGATIEQLIAVKARQGGGSAFRPAREAEMMRRLVERHGGPLPLDTVESIWRVIIATFTFVQASYAVHADMTAGDAAMRDAVRFHFGFTVPLRPCASPGGVVAAVAAAAGDLGIVPVAAAAGAVPPWRLLAGPDAPKIIARLPFVERSDHPAGLPVFVIARPSAAAAVRDVVLLLVEADGPEIADGSPADTVATAPGMRLLAVPGHAAQALAAQLGAVEVGSHAARYTVADTDPLRAP